MLSPIEKGRPLADALLTTNVRYRGFSGNIRERTAPISLDGTALQTLLELPDVKAWRDNGGLLISDAPGSVMVREYYSTTASSGSISVTQAALEAFQAGNDMLTAGRPAVPAMMLSRFAMSLRFSAEVFHRSGVSAARG